MTKHLSTSEFAEYVNNLDFEELKDLTAFVKSYFEEFKSTPNEDLEAKNAAWAKKMEITLKHGGHTFYVL